MDMIVKPAYEPLDDTGAKAPSAAASSKMKGKQSRADVVAPVTLLCGVLPEPPAIDPDSQWKQAWDLIILVLILYSAAAVPVQIAFEVDSTGWQWTMEVGFSLCFLTDLAFNFNLGFYDDGRLVEKRGLIIPRYLRGWFWIDAPSSVPVELIELYMESGGHGGDTGSLALLRILRMFRLVRLLRLLKVDHYMARLEEEFEVNLRAVRLVSLILKLLFMSHLLGCGWMAIVTFADDPHHPSWITVFEERRRMLRKKDDDDDLYADDDEALNFDHTTVPLDRRYFYAFYWALCTLVGSGSPDVVPVTDAERKFDAATALLSALVFGYVIGEIGTLLASLDRQSALVEEKMDAIKEYLQWRKVPRHLSVRVRRYYEFYFTQAAVFDESEILEPLPPGLHKEVVTYVTSDTLLKVPLFRRVDPKILTHILPILKPMALSIGDVVYARGQESSSLCFIVKGEVVFLDPYSTPGAEVVEARMTREQLLIYPPGDPSHEDYTEDEDVVKAPAAADTESPAAAPAAATSTPPGPAAPSHAPSKGGRVEVIEGNDSPQGCFGHSVMLGKRRRNTVLASEQTELLTIDKDDIAGLFAEDKDPVNARYLCTIVLLAHKEADLHLAVRTGRFRKFVMSEDDRRVSMIQRTFTKYTVRAKAAKYDALYKHIHEDTGGSGGGAEEALPDAESGGDGGAFGGGVVSGAVAKQVAALEAKCEQRFKTLDEKLDALLKRSGGGLASFRRSQESVEAKKRLSTGATPRGTPRSL